MATFVVYVAIISFYKIDIFIVVHLSTLNESNLKHRRSLSTTTDDQLLVLCCSPRNLEVPGRVPSQYRNVAFLMKWVPLNTGTPKWRTYNLQTSHFNTY